MTSIRISVSSDRVISLSLPPTNAISDSPDGAEVSSKPFGDAGKRLVSIWKQRCRTLNTLWRYWYEDYLLSLRERRKVSHKAGRSDVDKTPLLHQVVLICDPDAPRGQWRLARISNLVLGNDGRIRSAELLLPNRTRLRRPLNHLVPLEVEHSDETDDPRHEPQATNEDVLPDDPDETRQRDSQSGAQLTDGTTDAQPTDGTTDDDDDGFLGFSQQDIQRTIDALQRVDDLAPSGARSD